jgi:hypothetical protein
VEVGMRAIGLLLAEFRNSMTNGIRKRIQQIKEWFEITPEESWDYWHWHEGFAARSLIPGSIEECETHYAKIMGTWNLNGDHIDAKWDDGSVGILKSAKLKPE